MRDIQKSFDSLFPIKKPVIFLHAHPDDESFLSAGLIQELVSKGRKVIIVYTAAGISIDKPITILRQKEARRVGNLLKAHKVLFLDFCDIKFTKQNKKGILNYSLKRMSSNLIATLNLIEITEPFILISYDKNGGYGHIDHKAIHKLGEKIKKDFGTSVYEVTICRDKIKTWIKKQKAKLMSPLLLPKIEYWSKSFGLSKNKITHFHTLNINQLKIKRKALAIHKTQMSNKDFPLSLHANDFQQVFGKEFLSVLD